MALTQAYLKQRLHYDPLTGVFTWLPIVGDEHWVASFNTRYAGKEAGTKNGHGGHTTIMVDGRSYLAHRLAWLYQTGEFPPCDIDHEDTDGGNNSWANLRLATESQNAANARRSPRNSSGVKGVHWHKANQKWVARIMVQYRSIYLGSFPTLNEAAAAYAAASEKYFGQFGRVA